MSKKYCITNVSKMLIVQLILSSIGLVIGCLWGLDLENKKWDDLIYKNIKIEGIDLGGKTKEEARNIIRSQYIEDVQDKKVYITDREKTYAIDCSKIIMDTDMDEVIDDAFNYGKNLGIIEKYNAINHKSGENLSLDFIFNDKEVNEFLATIEKDINKSPINATVAINTEGIPKINADAKGYTLDKVSLFNMIEDDIKSGTDKNINITAPVSNIEATVTENELSPINSCISTFSTSFQTSSLTRANNINICVNAINGKILMPGETFSFNGVVGERTKERGYMEAPVIVGNKVESGLGGGICQVSSTLYNAVLRTGIQRIERKSHSLPSSYVGLGLDATIDWGNIDFKFENTFNYPIYIQSKIENKNIYISLYSNAELNKKKYQIENDITQTGNGRNVKVIRKTYENEVMTNTEVITNEIL